MHLKLIMMVLVGGLFNVHPHFVGCKEEIWGKKVTRLGWKKSLSATALKDLVRDKKVTVEEEVRSTPVMPLHQKRNRLIRQVNSTGYTLFKTL